MFNETSYQCGLGDAAAVQRRLDAGKRVKQTKLDRFGIVAPPGYTTLPLPKPPLVGPAAGSGGMLIPDSETPDPNLAPPVDDSGGGFDLGGIGDIFSSIPWYLWALGAYFLLKKR